MKRRSLVTLALASALLLGACGGGSAGPGPVGEGLEGRTFLSAGIEGHVLVPGSTVRLSFQGGRLSASAGCNSMSGTYRIDGGRLILEELATTEMGCEARLMDQDRWLAEFLDGASIALDADGLALTNSAFRLALTNGAVRLTLLDREISDPDRPLLGTRWVVDGLIGGDAVSSIPVGVVAALSFTEGRVDVEAGCNQGGGTVRITDTTIDFGPIGLTKRGCSPEIMAVEQAVGAVLSGTTRYRIEAGNLTIDAGGAGLMLRAAP